MSPTGVRKASWVIKRQTVKYEMESQCQCEAAIFVTMFIKTSNLSDSLLSLLFSRPTGQEACAHLKIS